MSDFETLKYLPPLSGSLSMNRHSEIPPLSPTVVHSIQSPDPLGNGGAGESSMRAGLPPPHRSSFPPMSPYSQIPASRQAAGPQNFSPGPGSLSGSMSSQQTPVFSFDHLQPFRDSPSAPVANRDAALPPLPFRRPGSARASQPPRKAHRRTSSDMIISELNALMTQSSPRMIYPKPIEIPVGVKSVKESAGETKSKSKAKSKPHGEEGMEEDEDEEEEEEILSEYMNQLDGSDDMERDSSGSDGGGHEKNKTTLGVKRRAGKEIAHGRSVSVDTSLNGGESSELPPSIGNLLDQGKETAFAREFKDILFTASDIRKIVRSNKLTQLASSDPKHCKRILTNRESAARSKEKKARHVSELENRVQTLEIEATANAAMLKHEERKNIVLENENKELRIRLQGMEENAKLRESLVEQLTGEVQRLKVATGESDRSSMQSLNANMFQQLNINQLHRPQN